MLPYSTRPSVDAILAAVPGLAPYARPAVVLHPTQGAPGLHESSVAGPLLWPADEPWPHCSVPDEREPSGLPPVAMVPVAQVFRRDAPGDWWPEDADVFQLLWCPNVHWDPPAPQADVSPVGDVPVPRRSHEVQQPGEVASLDGGFLRGAQVHVEAHGHGTYPGALTTALVPVRNVRRLAFRGQGRV